MTDGLDEGPTEEDRRLAADHDDEGVDVALAIDVPLRGNVVVAPVPHHGPVLRLMVAIRWPLATLSPI